MNNRIWNPDMECMSRKDLEALQLERLKALVDYCDIQNFITTAS